MVLASVLHDEAVGYIDKLPELRQVCSKQTQRSSFPKLHNKSRSLSAKAKAVRHACLFRNARCKYHTIETDA